MRRFFVANVLLISSIFTVAAASDAEFLKVGDWTVQINEANSNACYASRMMEDGSEVQIGAEPELQSGYFAIYNPKWTHIKEDSVGSVEFHFGNARFGGDSVGRIRDGVPGGYALFDNPAFLDAFVKGQNVEVTGSGGAVYDMDLTGTSKAVKAVLECQAAQNK